VYRSFLGFRGVKMDNINTNFNKDGFANISVKEPENELVAKSVNHQNSMNDEARRINKLGRNGEVEQSLLESVDKLETLAQLNSKQFKFHIDEQTKSSVVVVTDKETNEVIRQIPSEEVLELASKIDELQEQIFGQPLGVLFDQKI
jgi:flagellar protein FlaG